MLFLFLVHAGLQTTSVLVLVTQKQSHEANREIEKERSNEMKGVLSLISIFLVLVLSGRCSDAYSRNDFPKGFSFGSATSAYQVPVSIPSFFHFFSNILLFSENEMFVGF